MKLRSTLGVTALLGVTLITGGISASTSADASTKASATTTNPASTSQLNWNDSHTPTRRWSTQDFTLRKNGKLHFYARCSSSGSGDRTTITVKLIRTSTGNTWASVTGSCGVPVGSSVNVSRGVSYYMRISVTATRALNAYAWG